MNITGNVPIPVTITITSDQSNSSLEFVYIIVPALLAPVIGLFCWFIRGHFEKQSKSFEQHRDSKKKYIIENYEKQLACFYWPLYLRLIRYKRLADRYNEFKIGKFSLDPSTRGDKPQVDRSFEDQKTNLSVEIIDADNPIVLPTDEKQESESSSNKDIKSEEHLLTDQQNKGLGLKNAIKIISKFTQATDEYENKMVLSLKEIQKTYTEFAPIAEPDAQLLSELMKLDEYITYVTTFRDLSENDSNDPIITKKIEKAKFPDKIYILIESRLHLLQTRYNDLIYNHNSPILDNHKNPQNNPTIDNHINLQNSPIHKNKANNLSPPKLSAFNINNANHANSEMTVIDIK
jgi:hypothetical protein